MTKIKICGLRTREDIAAVNAAKPDFAGFIVEYPRSFRSVSAEEVKALSAGLSGEIIPVGVFVNAPLELVTGLLECGAIRMAQLHGQEDEAYLGTLRSYTDQPLIRAFSVGSREDAELALTSTADYILLDQGGGGTGKTFDWSLVPGISRPYFLAGGLGAENLRRAVETLHPWAVDVSSGVETERRKDPQKIRETVQLVRSLR